MNNLTILTPTYNRASHLRKLYDSLTGQTDPDFEWLVVDDGSTDETQELLEELMQEHRLQMRVLRQENGGKHRALNRGIAQIETELTFLVDSDDYLPPEAVETIHRYHEKYYETFCKSIAVKDARDIPENDSDVILCGYSFLRCHADGRVNTAYFPEDEMIGTYRDVRINGNIGGDKAEVFYTEILKRYPFPTFEGEKHLHLRLPRGRSDEVGTPDEGPFAEGNDASIPGISGGSGGAFSRKTEDDAALSDLWTVCGDEAWQTAFGRVPERTVRSLYSSLLSDLSQVEKRRVTIAISGEVCYNENKCGILL